LPFADGMKIQKPHRHCISNGYFTYAEYLPTAF